MKALKKLRERRKLTQLDVAESVGYSVVTVYNIENDKKFSYVTLLDFLDFYGYELKIAPKGMFDTDLIEFTDEFPTEAHLDTDVDKEYVEEFGIPLVTDDEYLVLGSDGNVYTGHLYKYDDGKIETENQCGYDVVAWMEKPKVGGD